MQITLGIISLLDNFVKSKGIKFLLVEGVYKPAFEKKSKSRFIKVYGNKFDFEKVTKIIENHAQKNNIEFMSLPTIIKERKIDVARNN